MRKIKKIAAVLMLGVMLCGSVLTADAACGHAHGAQPRWSYSEPAGTTTHVYGNGKTCEITKIIDHYNVICNDCGSVIGTYTTSYEKHSVNH